MEINGIGRTGLEIFPPLSSSEKITADKVTATPGQEKVTELSNSEKNMTKPHKENQEETHEKLQEAVDKINKTAVIFDRSLRFQIHEKTHRTMVSVIDIVKDKVIREIPPKEVLDLLAKMQDYIGLIFDKKV